MRGNLIRAKKRLPRGYWDVLENRQQFLVDLFHFKKFVNLEDFYQVNNKFFIANGGVGVLSKYSNSYIQLLLSIFPNYPWNVCNFKVVPKNYWMDPANHRKFLENFAQTKHIDSKDDWYNISLSDIIKNKGQFLVKKYDGIGKSIKENFPEFKWEFGKKGFHHSRGYWNSIENQKEFLDNFANRKNILSTKDWFNVTNLDIMRAGGSGLLQKYGSSIFFMLQTLYPEKEWCILESPARKSKYWKKVDNMSTFLMTVQRKYGIERPEDWCRISFSQIENIAGRSLWRGGIRHALECVHPDQDWNRIFRSSNQRKIRQK